jgi:hypothetical protein
LINNQNDHIAKLDAMIVEYELENEKFKFARSMLYNGRRPGIKDGVGFQPGGKDNTKINAQEKRIPQFVKGKAPIVNDDSAYIVYPKNYYKNVHSKNAHVHQFATRHAYIYKHEASNSRHSMSHAKPPKIPKNKIDASTEPQLLFNTSDASYVLISKSDKVFAKYIESRNKNPKTCAGVPNVHVSNVKGSNTFWVHNNKA